MFKRLLGFLYTTFLAGKKVRVKVKDKTIVEVTLPDPTNETK